MLTGIAVAPLAGMVGDPVRGTCSFTISIEVKVNEPGEIAVFVQCNDKITNLFFRRVVSLRRNSTDAVSNVGTTYSNVSSQEIC